MKKLFEILCVVFLASCSTGSGGGTSDYIAGMYSVGEGVYQYIDNFGTFEEIDFAEIDDGYIGVIQSGDAVYSFGCLGVWDGNSMSCDAEAYGLTSYGFYYSTTDGSLSAHGECLKLKGSTTMSHVQLGYSYQTNINVVMCFDEEATQFCQDGSPG